MRNGTIKTFSSDHIFDQLGESQTSWLLKSSFFILAVALEALEGCGEKKYVAKEAKEKQVRSPHMMVAAQQQEENTLSESAALKVTEKYLFCYRYINYLCINQQPGSRVSAFL